MRPKQGGIRQLCGVVQTTCIHFTWELAARAGPQLHSRPTRQKLRGGGQQSVLTGHRVSLMQAV